MQSMLRHWLLLLTIGFAAAAPLSSNAESKQHLGGWNVHYIAFPSTFLRPEIAREYDLERSGRLGVVNISVLSATDNQGSAQKVSLDGRAINPLGQAQELEFTEITEGESVYYIAQVRVDHLDVVRFVINITDTEGRSEQLRFSQQFYEEGR